MCAGCFVFPATLGRSHQIPKQRKLTTVVTQIQLPNIAGQSQQGATNVSTPPNDAHPRLCAEISIRRQKTMLKTHASISSFLEKTAKIAHTKRHQPTPTSPSCTLCPRDRLPVNTTDTLTEQPTEKPKGALTLLRRCAWRQPCEGSCPVQNQLIDSVVA